jgi:hypothetical protein
MKPIGIARLAAQFLDEGPQHLNLRGDSFPQLVMRFRNASVRYRKLLRGAYEAGAVRFVKVCKQVLIHPRLPSHPLLSAGPVLRLA